MVARGNCLQNPIPKRSLSQVRQIQSWLADSSGDPAAAKNAVRQLSARLESLKEKNAIFERIAFSEHVLDSDLNDG